MKNSCLETCSISDSYSLEALVVDDQYSLGKDEGSPIWVATKVKFTGTTAIIKSVAMSVSS